MQRDGGPGGAGGAGNPVGGSFTGPAEALEIVGDFGYAASGSIADAATGGANTTLLNFRTGNFTWVGTLDFTDTMVASNTVWLSVFMNGALINETLEAATQLIPMRFHFLIPPYTDFLVKWGNNHSTLNASVFMSGRIYRG